MTHRTTRTALVTLASAAAVAAAVPASTTPAVRPNANTARAGVLKSGVLTVRLDATQSRWWLNGPKRSPMTIAAFAESGREPLMPGPLIRAREGTELRLTIHNSLGRPLTFYIPSAVRIADDAAMDSVVVAPGMIGHISARLDVLGNYIYRAATASGASRVMQFAGLLSGALVVDSAQSPANPRDRVFVIMGTPDSTWVAFADTAPFSLASRNSLPAGRLVWTINGESWPGTERIHATVGDSLRWRIINASREPHPMHMHGFYYRVDAFAAPQAGRFGHPAPGQMVVTQLMSPFSTMSMTWSPTRPGNWLFHCHIAVHLAPDSLSAAPDDPDMRDMTGLVLGVLVRGRPGVTLAGAAASTPVRRIRLVAEGGVAKPGTLVTDSVPAMRFRLEDGERTIAGGRDFSPELDLVRGEPVAITIVNHLGEPTSVHWHGIEVEDSYVDGVPGFSGDGRRLSPAIAPGDSFVARFTPPRAGTFMYHAHVDELLQQGAGMEGALIVRDPRDSLPVDDHVFFLKGVTGSVEHPVEIDGHAVPDTVVLHAGHAARFRLINLATINVDPIADLTANPDSALTSPRDTMIVRWRPIAKDGFDVPSAAQTLARAAQDVADGETYDFLYTPRSPGMLHLEFRTNGPAHRLIIRVPIRVE
ncbi:MAG TPA: multicopper oxidase domain-containing protein [Gemmatimonadaceae bacterium]|nr:multicopper oxidase domain-containing protein [Gemmatimonadaceae bacterium]